MGIVRAILNWGVDRGHIAKAPFYRLSHRKINTHDHSVDAPAHEELQAIYDQAAKHLQRFIVLGMYTGARPGPSELLNLKWADVNWKENYILVRSAMKGGAQARKVHIHPRLREYLSTWHRQDRGQVEYIAHYLGKKIKDVRCAWYTAKEKAGIDRPLTPYSLRHYFASQALAAGADVRSVASILGNTPNIVLNTYAHAVEKQLKQTVESIPNLGSEF